MEQPCYKCGQLLEEGRPFCPHCGAPQIRVVIAETVPAAKAFSNVEAGAQGEASLPAAETVPVLAVPVRWSQAFKPCILAAIVATLLMFLGLNALVGMLSAGFLAVVFYRGGRPGAVLRPGSGARLGTFSGLLAFAISAFMVALAAMVPDLRSKLQQQLIDNVQKVATSRPADPRFQILLEQLKTPEGFISVLIIAGVMLLIIALVLASFSGAVTAAMLSRRERR